MLYGLAHSSLSREDDVAAMWRRSRTARCQGGSAAGFPCERRSRGPPAAQRVLTNTVEAPAAANGLWGLDPQKREFVIWGVSEGHFGVEVIDSSPVVLAFVPSTDERASVWHDVKVLGDYAYGRDACGSWQIRSEAPVDHRPKKDGMQELLIDVFGTDTYP